MKFPLNVLFFCSAVLTADASVLENPALNKVKILSPPEQHAEVQMVRDGTPDFTIVYDAQAESHLKHPAWKSIEPAIAVLRENIRKATQYAFKTRQPLPPAPHVSGHQEQA